MLPLKINGESRASQPRGVSGCVTTPKHDALFLEVEEWDYHLLSGGLGQLCL